MTRSAQRPSTLAIPTTKPFRRHGAPEAGRRTSFKAADESSPSAVLDLGLSGNDGGSAVRLRRNGRQPKAVGLYFSVKPNEALAVRKADALVGVRPPIARDPAGHRGVMFSVAEKRVTSQRLAEAALAKLVH